MPPIATQTRTVLLGGVAVLAVGGSLWVSKFWEPVEPSDNESAVVSSFRQSRKEVSVRDASQFAADPSSFVEQARNQNVVLNLEDGAFEKRVHPYAHLDAGNALEIYRQLLTDPVRWEREQYAFYEAWGAVDPQSALRHCQELKGKNEISRTSSILRGWALVDSAEAQAWVENLPTQKGRTRQVLAQGVLQGMLAEAEVSEMGIWAGKFVRERHTAPLVTQVFDVWRDENSSEAVDWLFSLPETEGRHSAIEQAFHKWGKSDAEAVAAILESQESGLTKDFAVAGFVKSIARDNQEIAALWAETISQENLKNNVINTLTSYDNSIIN